MHPRCTHMQASSAWGSQAAHSCGARTASKGRAVASPGSRAGLCAGKAPGGAGGRGVPGLAARPCDRGRGSAVGCALGVRACGGPVAAKGSGSAAQEVPARAPAVGAGVVLEAGSNIRVPEIQSARALCEAAAAGGDRQVHEVGIPAGWQGGGEAAAGGSRGSDEPGSGPNGFSADGGAAAVADEDEVLQKLWRVLRSSDAADVRKAQSAGWQGQAYSKLRALLTSQGQAPARSGAGPPAEAAPASAAGRPAASPISGDSGSDLQSASDCAAERGAGSRANAARAGAVVQLLRALLERFPRPHTRWTVLLVEALAAHLPDGLPEALALLPLEAGDLYARALGALAQRLAQIKASASARGDRAPLGAAGKVRKATRAVLAGMLADPRVRIRRGAPTSRGIGPVPPAITAAENKAAMYAGSAVLDGPASAARAPAGSSAVHPQRGRGGFTEGAPLVGGSRGVQAGPEAGMAGEKPGAVGAADGAGAAHTGSAQLGPAPDLASRAGCDSGAHTPAAPGPSAKNRRLAEPKAAAQAALEDGLGLRAWRAAFLAFSRLEEPAGAAALFTEMWERGAWVPADTWTARDFLDALTTDASAAFAWHARMQAGGLANDSDVCRVLLKAAMRCADAPRTEQGLALLRDAGLQVSDVMYTSAVMAFGHAGRLDRALQVFEEALERGFTHNARLWMALMEQCARAGQVETAVALWRRMPEAGVVPMPGTLATVLRACRIAYQGERALSLLAEARGAGMRADMVVYNEAIGALHTPRGTSLSPAVLDAALRLLDEARAAVLRPDRVTYVFLFMLCERAGQGAAALQLAQARMALKTVYLHKTMEADGIRGDKQLLGALIRALGAGGLVDEAHAVFRTMVWGPRARRPSQETYREMMRLLREAGRLQEALHVCAGLRQTGGRPGGEEWRALTAAAAEAALRDGSTGLACKVAEGLGLDVAAAGAGAAQVDLHGLGAAEARAAVLCLLKTLQQRAAQGAPPPAALAFITGVGKRSADTGPVLREAVRRLLVDELHLLPEGADGHANADAAASPAAASNAQDAVGSAASPGQAMGLVHGRPHAAAVLAGNNAGSDAGHSVGPSQGRARPRASDMGPLRHHVSAGEARQLLPGERGSGWRGGDNPGRIVLSQAELARWLARHAAHDPRRNPAP